MMEVIFEYFLAYGNPLIRQKKIKLIKMIEGYMNNGQYYKKLKKTKSSKKVVAKKWQENEFVNNYDEQIENVYEQQQEQSMLERYSNVRNKQNYYRQEEKSKYDQKLEENEFAQYEQPITQKQNRIVQQQGTKKYGAQNEDERPIGGKGTYNYQEQEQDYQNDDRPIGGKGQYDDYPVGGREEFDDRPIGGKGTYGEFDDRPIGGKGTYGEFDDRPIGGKGTYGEFDDRPIGSKGTYGEFDDRPIGGKGTYGEFDDRPIGGKGTYGEFDDRPIGGKGKYDEFEDEQPKQQAKPVKKKPELKKKVAKQPQEQAKPYEDQNEPPQVQDFEEPQEQENKKQKKKDPKLLENLKKRTKYDPRKAIQQAKQKQEEQMMQEQAESEIKQQECEIKQQAESEKPSGMPKEKTKQIQSQQVLPENRSVTPSKINLSATQDKSTPPHVGECSPKEDPYQDNKPKNFLKRKSKQIPLNNPKVDPKQVKSKVKNCWNGVMEDQDIDEDCPQSPKVNNISKSPQRKFEQKQEALQQQKTGPIHVQVQLPQYQQQQKRVIQIEELERAYNSNYSQKFETTMKNLKSLVEERLQHPEGVPIITTRSRFFTSFKVNDFERLLAQLEDQYNRLQVSK